MNFQVSKSVLTNILRWVERFFQVIKVKEKFGKFWVLTVKSKIFQIFLWLWWLGKIVLLNVKCLSIQIWKPENSYFMIKIILITTMVPHNVQFQLEMYTQNSRISLKLNFHALIWYIMVPKIVPKVWSRKIWCLKFLKPYPLPSNDHLTTLYKILNFHDFPIFKNMILWL